MTMDRTVTYGGAGGHGPVVKPPAQVPIGWQRRIHHGGVVYISPSGSLLACLEQAERYLQTDGTCKCGLECPLILHKVFNFDPGAAVTQRTAEDVKADSAVTKLCIHKRKILAVATLHRSMQAQISSRSAGGCQIGSLNPQAIRLDLRSAPSDPLPHDGAGSYKLPPPAPPHYVHKHPLGSPPRRDAYAHQARLRPGAGDHTAQRSPYRGNHHSGLLSPPATTPTPQHYGDRTPFLRSPEAAALGFHGPLSPGPGHLNGERYGPLSPPGVALSCARAGRTSVSSSPSMNTKSPSRQRSPCSFPQNPDYIMNQKAPSASSAPALQHAPYVVQKRCMTSSEKDPLGILDPIPSLSDFQEQAAPTPPRLQVNSHHPQVASAHAPPPAVVPLPSNLPMPAVKSGAAGSGPRGPQHPALSSPGRSPAHMALPPAPVRLKDSSSLRPHTPASSSHYAPGTLLSPPQQQPPRSTQGHASSPKISVPLHHMAESVIQPPPALHSGGGGGGMHSEPTRLPPPHRADGLGLTRLPLRPPAGPRHPERLNPPTFPASSLLSAAAKAQLVHQNNLGGSSGHPGLVGGGRQPYGEGCGPQDPQYLRGPGVSSGEAQSGRAALRDKLMSQQRVSQPPPPPRKRKPPGEADGGASFQVNMHHGYPEPAKRLLQQAAAVDASMAPLVQPMNHPLEAQNGLNHACQPPPPPSGKPQFFEESVPSLSNAHGPLHLQIRDLAAYRGFSKDCADDRGEPLHMEQFARQGTPTHNLPFVGNIRTLSYGGHPVEGSVCNPNSLQPQTGHHVKPPQGSLGFKDGTGFPQLMSNGGFEMYPESGKARFLEPESRKLPNGGQRRRQQKQPPKDASGQLPVPAGDFLRCPDSLSCRESSHLPRSPGPTNGFLRPFKASLAERIVHPASRVSDHPHAAGLSDAVSFQACQQARSAEETLTGRGVRAGPRGGTASSVIVRNCAFPAPQAAAPAELSQPVLNGSPRPPYPGEPARPPARARRTPAKLKPSNGASAAPEAPLHFGRGVRWGPSADGGPQYGPGQSERSLPQPRAPEVNGNGFYGDFLARQAFAGPQEQVPPPLNGSHHRNGQPGPGRARGPAPAAIIIRSPEYCPAPDGPQAYFPKRSNGYLSGQLSGNYGGEGSLNGSFVLNIAGGQVSQERLMEPGGLHHQHHHHQGRPPAQPGGGDPLWAGAPAFHPWSSKMKMEAPSYLCSVREMMQSKVEPVRFHPTFQEDLDPSHKAKGVHRGAGAVDDHMEDALHNAMGQWHSFTANVGLDVVRKAPKAKKRKIFR